MVSINERHLIKRLIIQVGGVQVVQFVAKKPRSNLVHWPRIVCEFCGDRFFQQSILQEHISTLHDRRRNVTQPITILNPEGPKLFDDGGCIASSSNRVPAAEKPSTPVSVEPVEIPAAPVGDEPCEMLDESVSDEPIPKTTTPTHDEMTTVSTVEPSTLVKPPLKHSKCFSGKQKTNITECVPRKQRQKKPKKVKGRTGSNEAKNQH